MLARCKTECSRWLKGVFGRLPRRVVDCNVAGRLAGLHSDQPEVGSGLAEDPEVRALKQGTVEITHEPELRELLKQGRPLRVKCGFDPTAPELHLGHAVLLRKLRQFQDLGHEVVFVIGDFTATIGDPTGRNVQRPSLTEAQIEGNSAVFLKQAFLILNAEKTRVVRNSEWFKSPGDLIKLMATHTLSQMLEREDFSKRFESEQPIHLHELMYPLLQGFDSVALEADIELGGTDQKFNLHAGRELQRQHGQRPQVIITMPIIVGTDGVNKMSKSLGNHIGLAEAASSQFAKLMSVSDETAVQFRQALTSMDAEGHPKMMKKAMALAIVAMLHGAEEAFRAQDEWERQHERRERPEMETVTVPRDRLDRVLVSAGLAPSNAEANRMIKAGAVSVDGTKQFSNKFEFPDSSAVVRLGRNWKRIEFASVAELADAQGREPCG